RRRSGCWPTWEREWRRARPVRAASGGAHRARGRGERASSRRGFWSFVSRCLSVSRGVRGGRGGGVRRERGELHLTHVESTPLGATMESMKTRGSHQGAALMKRTRKYVGLDVHQASTVVSVRGESGRVIWRTVLPTEAEALLEFVGGMQGSVQVAFEEGTQAQWLYDLLVGVVERVVVCDRRGERRRGNKGDVKDAERLSEDLWRGRVRPVYHGGGERGLRLKELSRAYRNLVEGSRRAMQRLKALYRARGIRTAGRRLYHPARRAEWLGKLEDAGARLRA